MKFINIIFTVIIAINALLIINAVKYECVGLSETPCFLEINLENEHEYHAVVSVTKNEEVKKRMNDLYNERNTIERVEDLLEDITTNNYTRGMVQEVCKNLNVYCNFYTYIEFEK